MKELMQVTSPREIGNNSVSYAYQIIYRKQPLGKPVYCYHKILIIHKVKESELRHFENPNTHTIYVRYIFSKDGVFHNKYGSFHFVGYFDSFDDAIKRVKKIVEKNGSGSKKQWEAFFKKRVGAK